MKNGTWHLRQDFKYAKKDKVLMVVCDGILNITGDINSYIYVLDELKNGVSNVKYERILKSNNEFVNLLRLRGYLYFLEDDIIFPKFCSRTIHYLATKSDYPYQALSKIQNSSVMILGLGGTGGVILQHLVSAGVANFILVDNASVNIEDLNRQFIYRRKDVGMLKVDAAKDYILQLNSDCKVEAHCNYISGIDCLVKIFKEEISLIINAIDTPNNIDEIVCEFSKRYHKPLYLAGVGINDAQAGPLFIPGETSCPVCYIESLKSLRSDSEQFARNIYTKPPKASCGPTNSIVSSIASLEISQFLYGIANDQAQEMKYISFNPLSYEIVVNQVKCECW